MKHVLPAALAVAALAVASAAQAQDNERGFYAGAGIGMFDVEIDDFDDVDDTIDRYDSDDTAWKAFVGWRVRPFLALELAYVNLGSPDDGLGAPFYVMERVLGHICRNALPPGYAETPEHRRSIGEVARTENGGESWENVHGAIHDDFHALAVRPSQGEIRYTATRT